MLAAGPIPAWLHVVTCEHGGVSLAESGTDTAHSVSSDCCGDSHSCHDLTDYDEAETDDEHKSGESPEHDSEHCSICQSLALPGGLIVAQVVAATSAAISTFCPPEYSLLVAGELLGFCQPRGPPQGVSSANS